MLEREHYWNALYRITRGIGRRDDVCVDLLSISSVGASMALGIDDDRDMQTAARTWPRFRQYSLS